MQLHMCDGGCHPNVRSLHRDTLFFIPRLIFFHLTGSGWNINLAEEDYNLVSNPDWSGQKYMDSNQFQEENPPALKFYTQVTSLLSAPYFRTITRIYSSHLKLIELEFKEMNTLNNNSWYIPWKHQFFHKSPWSVKIYFDMVWQRINQTGQQTRHVRALDQCQSILHHISDPWLIDWSIDWLINFYHNYDPFMKRRRKSLY